MSSANRHATAVIVGDRGILITGESGSGKTTLALALLAAAQAAHQFARFVGDDQIWLDNRAGRLVARAPESIAGLAEVFGKGPSRVTHENEAVIDLSFHLVAPENVPRLQEEGVLECCGIVLPQLLLPQRNVAQSLPVLLARLALQPFAGLLPGA